MGRSSSLSVLLISALLLLSFSHDTICVWNRRTYGNSRASNGSGSRLCPGYFKGLGRKLTQTFGNEGDSAVPSEENAGFSRVLLSDYTYPGANTNESGYYISPSDQTPDVP